MRWTWWMVGLWACAGGTGPAEPTETGETKCFAYDAGSECAVDTCCTDLACWYQADDGTRWDCADPGLCRESEAEAARDHCGIVEESRPSFDTPCHWTGTWALVTAMCGSSIEFDEIGRFYPDTLVHFAERDGGGCEVTIDWLSAYGCQAVETWSMSSDAIKTPSDMEVELHGIQACDPEVMCSLGDDQNPVDCWVGARTNTVASQLSEDAFGDITWTGPWHRDVIPMCRDTLSVTLTPYEPE